METFLLQQLYICRLLHTLQSYVRIFKCVYCGNGAWVLLFLTADAKWFDGVSWWDRNKRRNQCCVFQKCYSFFVNHAARHPHSLLLFSSVFLFLQTFFLQVVVSSLLSASFSLSHAQSCVQERYTFTSWQQAWGCRWNYTISHMHTLTRTHTQQSNLPQYTAEKQSLSCCNSASRPLPPVLCWHTRTHTHMHRHTHTQSHKFSTIMPQTQKSMCGWDPSHPSGAHTDADLKPGIHSAVPGLLSQTKCLWSYFQNDSPAPQSNKGSGFVVTTVLWPKIAWNNILIVSKI